MATSFSEVYDSFESSFQDKCVIPEALELLWLKKAVAQYCIEIEDISYDEEMQEFSTKLDQYTIDSIAQAMKVFYLEREVSKVNKRVSIVSKDLSVDGNNLGKAAARLELERNDSKMEQMYFNQKPTAYA